MQFHTWVFGLFFLVFYAVYVPLQRTRLRLPWLLLASYFFYGWYNPRYPVLILYVTVVDYLVVLCMARDAVEEAVAAVERGQQPGRAGLRQVQHLPGRQLQLAAGAVGRAADSRADGRLAGPGPGLTCWQRSGIGAALPAASALPAGISFFTFRSLTYTIDYFARQDREGAQSDPLCGLRGVLSRAADGADRSGRRPAAAAPPSARTIGSQDVADGLSLFVVGLFKKLALADYMAVYVAKVYAAPGQFQSADLLLGTFVFAWQIYFDFSGYSDMARGVGRLLGYKLALELQQSLPGHRPGRLLEADGTSACRTGSRITSTSRWAAIATASSAPT